jgi:hypothetical protein
MFGIKRRVVILHDHYAYNTLMLYSALTAMSSPAYLNRLNEVV